MSSKRASGSGPALDHEPSFDSEFDVSDEALNARPDARARAGRPGPRKPAGGSGGRILIAGVGLAVVAAAGLVAFKMLAPAPTAPEPPPSPPVAEAPAVAPSPAPEAKPEPKPEAKPEPKPEPKVEPKPEPPVTKVAETVIEAAEDDEPAAAPTKTTRKRKKGKRGTSDDEPDLRLDSALEKLGSIQAPPAAAPSEGEPAPAASSPGADCEAGKADACVTFGKSLAGKDFNAALTAFERGCALGANKGCLEGTRLAEKAGGGEKARELSSIACGRGSATGCRLLASLFQRGVGGAPDPDKAKTFYAKACEAGDTAACGQ